MFAFCFISSAKKRRWRFLQSYTRMRLDFDSALVCFVCIFLEATMQEGVEQL